MSQVGEIEITDRQGNRHTVLAWDDGRRAAAEGRDFRAIVRRLPTERLRFWMMRFGAPSPHERDVLLEEIGRRTVRRRRKERPGQRLLFREW